jgi:hypothetical protein
VRFFWFQLFRAFLRFERAQEDFLRSAFQLRAR